MYFLILSLNVKPSEDYHGGIGSQPLEVSIEKQRTNLDNNDMRTEILMEELRTNLNNNGIGVTEANGVPVPEVNLMTPNNSGMLTDETALTIASILWQEEIVVSYEYKEILCTKILLRVEL